MSPLTIFTWGYSGWGNATREFVRVVDAVEQSRGFRPPLFVDIRIRRTVRAVGFQGRAFEELVGPTRYRWIKTLGNRHIETRTGPSIQIADPSAAHDLLDLAVQSADRGRRVLVFCGCPFPLHEGRTACHRETVAGLLLAAAEEAGVNVELVEWPGGDPVSVEVSVPATVVAGLAKGRASVTLGGSVLSQVRCLPWGSAVKVRGGEREVTLISGPALVDGRNARLPVFERFATPIPTLQNVEQSARAFRRSRGLDARNTGS